MALRQSIFKVADNSGISYAKCINLPNGYKNKGLVLGSIITIYPKIIKISKKIQKKKYLGLVVTLKKKSKRFNGIFIKFNQNRLLVLNKKWFKFVGTRVDGPICKEVRRNKIHKIRHKRIISYSSVIL